MMKSGLGTIHLERTVLSKTAADLLEQLATSLPTDFVAQGKAKAFEILAPHPQLLQMVEPLLAELGLSNKVQQHIELFTFY
jgi:hypothetical protein